MVIKYIPIRIKIAAAALFLSIPLVAIEVIISTRSPFWKLPYRSMLNWMGCFTLVCIPLYLLVVSARKWALKALIFFYAIWIGISTWYALQLGHPSLGFYTVFLLFFILVHGMWLQFETTRSFFDPGLAWYEGLPKPIPGVQCKLVSNDCECGLEVSKIDNDGAFLFAPAFGSGKEQEKVQNLISSKNLKLILNFRDKQLECPGRVTMCIRQDYGLGFQFLGLTPDRVKDVSDFIEGLRGEGYV